MNFEDLLDQVDEMLDSAWGIAGKSLINTDKLRDFIDDIRLNMPQEIKQARNIVAEKTDIINTAKREAESIIKSAEEKAKVLVAEEEITRLAQAKAVEIVNGAQVKSKEMRNAAQEFVDDLMKKTDEELTQTLAEVRKTRASLRQQKPISSSIEEK